MTDLTPCPLPHEGRRAATHTRALTRIAEDEDTPGVQDDIVAAKRAWGRVFTEDERRAIQRATAADPSVERALRRLLDERPEFRKETQVRAPQRRTRR